MNKTENAKHLLQEGKFAEALAIIARFRMGFTHEEKRTLEIAKEIMGGHSLFYKRLGLDTQKVVSQAIEIIRNKYKYKIKSNENED